MPKRFMWRYAVARLMPSACAARATAYRHMKRFGIVAPQRG